MSDETTRDPLVVHLEREVDRHRIRLVEQCRDLAEHLTHVADRLETAPERTAINELGEVQARGPMVDVRCGTYATARDALKAALAFGKETNRAH